MALSGSFSENVVSGLGLECSWYASQSQSGNYSDITVSVTFNHISVYMSATYINVYIGSSVSGTITVPATSGTRNSTSGSVSDRVYHNSDGSLSLHLKVQWPFSISYGGATRSNITAETDISLNQIDRTAPTVTCSVSNITSNGFQITAASNTTANSWDYSIDGGSTWVNYSTAEGTSASVTISNAAAATSYSVKVRARKKSNLVYGTSSAVSVRTLGASTVNSAYDFAADEAYAVIKLNMKVLDATFYHGIVLKKGDADLFTVQAGTFTAGTADRSVTLTAAQRAALLSAMASEQSCEVTLTVTTYSDSGYKTAVGDASSAKCRATTSSALSAPDFTDFTYSDTEQRIVAITGNNQVLLRLHSFLQVVCTDCSAKNGASITGYSASIGNVSKTSAGTTLDVGAVDSEGDLTLSVTCTDSRGYGTTVKKAVKVLPYSDPKLSSCSLRRMNEIDSLIQLSFSGSISSLTWDESAEEYNEVTSIAFRYKKTSETEWSEMISLMEDVSFNGTYFSFESLELLELEDTSYNFHLQIQDKLYEISSLDLDLMILQGTPLIALRKRNNGYAYPRVGINNPVPKYPLDVGGDIASNGVVVLGFRKTLSGESFNTLKDGGIYFYSGDGESSNAPAASAGFLEVLSSGDDVIQRYTVMAAGHTQYFRAYASDQNAWTAWVEK